MSSKPAPPTAAGEEVKFAFSVEDAAKISICSVNHMQVLTAQINFLKEQIRLYQSVYNIVPLNLSVDRPPVLLKVLGRKATNFEASLASLLDHTSVISLPAAMHNFVVLMCKARSEEDRTLCLLILQEYCTDPCIEEFVVVGGIRIVSMWAREYEASSATRSLVQVAKLCCRIPFNATTKPEITKCTIVKTIKKLAKSEHKEYAEKCKLLWGEGNKAIAAAAAATATKEPQSSTEPNFPHLFLELRDLMRSKREEFCSARRAERELAERKKIEDKAKRALERNAPPPPAPLPVSSRGVSLESLLPKKASGTSKSVLAAPASSLSVSTADVEMPKSTRKVLSARTGISLKEKAVELLKSKKASSSILKTASGKSTPEPSSKKKKRVLTWTDEACQDDLVTKVEYELDEGWRIRVTCAQDKETRRHTAEARRAHVEQIKRYQAEFQMPNIMKTFNLKRNIYKFSLSPSELDRCALMQGVDVETCERKYINSQERENEKARIIGIPEAVYGESNPPPQDPTTFFDLLGQPVYTSHTYQKSRLMVYIDDSSSTSVVETAISPADVAAGANDRMSYQLAEKKMPPKVIPFQQSESEEYDMDDNSAPLDSGSSGTFGIMQDQMSQISSEMDLDGLSVNIGDNIQQQDESTSFDPNYDEISTDGLLSLQSLDPQMLNYLISNEDKFNELCVDGAIDETKAAALVESVRDFRGSTLSSDKQLDDIDLSIIFDLTMKKLSANTVGHFVSKDGEAAEKETLSKLLRLVEVKKSIPLSQLVLVYREFYNDRLEYTGKLKVYLEKLLEGCSEITITATNLLKFTPRNKKGIINDAKISSPNMVGNKRKFSSTATADVCAYFNSYSGCRNGNQCRFMHISG